LRRCDQSHQWVKCFADCSGVTGGASEGNTAKKDAEKKKEELDEKVWVSGQLFVDTGGVARDAKEWIHYQDEELCKRLYEDVEDERFVGYSDDESCAPATLKKKHTEQVEGVGDELDAGEERKPAAVKKRKTCGPQTWLQRKGRTCFRRTGGGESTREVCNADEQERIERNRVCASIVVA